MNIYIDNEKGIISMKILMSSEADECLVLQEFDGLAKAADFLIQNTDTTLKKNTLKAYISNNIHQKRKSVLGYVFTREYILSDGRALSQAEFDEL